MSDIWGSVITSAGSALGSYFGKDSGGGGKPVGADGKIRKRTDTSAEISDFDVLYSQQAVADMGPLTDKLAEWSDQDREFFTNVFQPYQEAVAQTNVSMLPAIATTSAATLEQNAKDLTANDTLKSIFRTKIAEGNTALDAAAERFQANLDNVPDEQTRVGQALTSVEAQFGALGKELTRDFASRGQVVSQASKRQLGIEKAKAKAGLTDTAAAGARAEKTQALQAGLTAAQTTAQVKAGVEAQQTQNLVSLQQAQQAGLATPQVEGGAIDQGDKGLEAVGLETGVKTTLSQQQFGTRAKTDVIEHVQKGIKMPVATSGAGGLAPAGAATLDAGLVQTGQPGTDADRVQAETKGVVNP